MDGDAEIRWLTWKMRKSDIVVGHVGRSSGVDESEGSRRGLLSL